MNGYEDTFIHCDNVKSSEMSSSAKSPATANSNLKPPRWIFVVLIAAGIYNLAWGTLAVLFPTPFFAWLQIEPPQYASLVQCIGMIVGVYGIGYAIAAFDPVRHWPIVLVGLLGKIFGPIGFLYTAWNGELPWAAGATLLTNDLAWWIPFVMILAFVARRPAARGESPISS